MSDRSVAVTRPDDTGPDLITTSVRPPWMTVPEHGPIGRVLRRRQRWLETLARGHPDARAIALHDLADDGRTEDRIRQG